MSNLPENPSAPTAYGTQPQAGYLKRLAKEKGFADVDAALASLQLSPPLSIEQASAVIDKLTKLPGATESGAKEVERKPRQRFLTARHLLQIHKGERSVPEDIDPDAVEVIQRLAALRDVQTVLGGLTAQKGVNAGGPILVQQLIEYFGSAEAVASTFQVSLETVKGWGAELPQKREFEAQVRTRGYVCARC
ncbi:MAG: hypothetical protein A2580_08635 [Hydrogenophilales bacterium RIFOXYD1_FULL_62_11]|nr:MAG: hypothetical protein A2580_08635 [Hydrogenophilales bacterium RIFOXYD1_FULL_62_11]